MGPYARVDYNLTFCPLQSRLQYIYHRQIRQPYARVGLNTKPESTLSPSHGLWIWPLGILCSILRVSLVMVNKREEAFF
jgi:hypothetical protein